MDVVYHLAAVVSGQAEAEFDLGMRVNVDATRTLLEACRRLKKPPRFIFTSTVAVFGGRLPDVVPDAAAVLPQSSYGAAKAIDELLVNEYSRRGFIDGIVCRLPTIAIRPGTPNAAASSFVSGIIREPLAGIDSCLSGAARHTAVDQLTRRGDAQSAARRPPRRIGVGGPPHVNLPGLSSRRRRCWRASNAWAARRCGSRVRCEIDQRIARIVCTWPGAFDVSRALRLGFSADRDIDSIIRQFMAERARQLRS